VRVGVTLASGRLGQAVIKALLKEIKSEEIVAFARNPEKVNIPEIEVRPGDYDQPEHFQAGLHGIASLLVISSNVEPEKRISQHRSIIQAAQENKVERLVYSSIAGGEKAGSFNSIIQSNRRTERDFHEAGIPWVIGRNSLYLEPDLEAIPDYIAVGAVANCAGTGVCNYTTREELGYAYTHMLLDGDHNGSTYTLAGPGLSQPELAEMINQVYGCNLSYEFMSIEEFRADRIKSLGPFMGEIVAGIYEGIHNGVFQLKSDFQRATGRHHKPHIDTINEFFESSKTYI